jgi:hypothetical protein
MSHFPLSASSEPRLDLATDAASIAGKYGGRRSSVAAKNRLKSEAKGAGL